MAAKSLKLAYFCWCIGGLYGLHHFYLGRDIHAFVTFATFGGYFGMGMIRDFWCMASYVQDANEDVDYMEKLHLSMGSTSQPSSSMARQFGLMIVGNLFALLVGYAIPDEILSDRNVKLLEMLLVPLASALGVWLVGNIGRHQGSLLKPLLASYSTIIPSQFFSIPLSSLTTFASMIVFNKYSKTWRRKQRRRSIVMRVTIITLAILVYLSLWSSWLYFKCTVEDNGEQIKCREALVNFMNSEAFKNLTEATWMLIEHARHSGWLNLWNQILQEFDISGKSSAYATLGLADGASSSEILARYKKLSREYHPDREKDELKKAVNQEKFIQVQEAYRRLMGSKLRYKMQRETNVHDDLPDRRQEL